MVFLFDRDGGRDAFDRVDIRFVHAIEKLPDIRREGFHITPLALGVERVKGEGGFARAGWAGDHREFAERDLEVEVAQIVLAASAQPNCGR